jgi:hypothetical protein
MIFIVFNAKATKKEIVQTLRMLTFVRGTTESSTSDIANHKTQETQKILSSFHSMVFLRSCAQTAQWDPLSLLCSLLGDNVL